MKLLIAAILLLSVALPGANSSAAFFGSSKPKSPLAPKPLPIRCVTNLKFMMDRRWKNEVHGERDPDFLHDYDYLNEANYVNKLGKLDTRYSEEFHTRFYFTATAKPRPDGTIPMIDPEAKAVYVYFHGSGTNKAGGVNFSYKMNKLASMGYAAFSFDMPYHSEGWRNPKLANTDAFYEYLHKLLNSVKNPGQPIYLVGHSFGPDLIAEYAYRYPFDITGIAMISPGSFNEVMTDWFMNHTAWMAKRWGDLVSNDDGARWAGMVSNGMKWRKANLKGRQDPTIVNPNLRIRVMSGDREEYVPGELDEDGLPTEKPRDYDVCAAIRLLFAHITCTIEPGVGHYIFEHKDANGHDVILRELLALNGDSLFQENEMKAEVSHRKYTEIEQVALRYSREPFFRDWLDMKYGIGEVEREIRENDLKTAREALKNFKWITDQREKALGENIKSTSKWAPAFYAQWKEMIDKIDGKQPISDKLRNAYLELLESEKTEVRSRLDAVTNDVYKLQEKKEIPEWVKQRMENGQGFNKRDKKNKSGQTENQTQEKDQPKQAS